MKRTPIDKRIKELEKELAAVHGSLRTLAKNPAKTRAVPAPAIPDAVAPGAAADARAPMPQRPAPPVSRPDVLGGEANLRGRDERFVDYLASSLGPTQPLRRERNAERNRALVAIAFALLLIFWIVSRFLFL